jgi:beta-glucosidase
VGRTIYLGNKINTTDKSEFAEAIAVAKQADVVVMVLERTWFAVWRREKQVGYWFTRCSARIIEAIYKVNPNIVLVLNNGRHYSLGC